LRQQQDSEWWSKLLQETLQARPAPTAPTLAELDSLVNRTVPGKQRHWSDGQGTQGGQASNGNKALLPLANGTSPAGVFSGEQDGRCLDSAPLEVLEDADELMDAEQHETLTPTPGLTSSSTSDKPPRGRRRLSGNGSDTVAGGGSRSRRVRHCPGNGRVSGKAEDITVEALLEGRLEKPKALLYNCRQRLTSTEKTANQATILHERTEYNAMAAAQSLAPDVLPRLPDSVFEPNMRILIDYFGSADAFPTSFQLGLVRRGALQIVEQPRLDPAKLLKVCWPWPMDPSLPSHFDARNPALSCMLAGQGQDPMPDNAKAQWCSDFLLQDALITIMSRANEGCGDLLGLARKVGEASSEPGSHTNCIDTIAIVKTLHRTVNAVAAIIQPEAITQEQLEALVELKDGANNFAKCLTPMLRQRWWAERLRQVWDTATTETVAHPAITDIIRACNDPNTTPQQIETAWTTVQSKLQRWQRDMRKGATKPLEDCLEQWLRKAMWAATAEPNKTADWVSSAEKLRSRATWFRDNVRPCLGLGTSWEGLHDLSTALQQAGANHKMAAGIESLVQLQADPTSEELVTKVLSALACCQGLLPDQSAMTTIREAVEMLREDSLPMTEERAKLAVTMLDLLEAGGTAVDTEPSLCAASWRRTRTGFMLLAQEKKLGSLKHGDAAARLAVKECLRAWGEGKAPVIGKSNGPIEAAVQQLNAWWSEARAHVMGHAVTAAQDAQKALAARAGGALDGLSWKAQVSHPNATWEELEREACYHLFPAKQPSVETELETMISDAEKALANLMDAASQMGECPQKTLVSDIQAAITRAHETRLESFIIRVLSREPADRRGKLIRRELMTMSKHHVEEERIHSLLWQRAKVSAAA
jgi:hypothetical protein